MVQTRENLIQSDLYRKEIFGSYNLKVRTRSSSCRQSLIHWLKSCHQDLSSASWAGTASPHTVQAGSGAPLAALTVVRRRLSSLKLQQSSHIGEVHTGVRTHSWTRCCASQWDTMIGWQHTASVPAEGQREGDSGPSKSWYWHKRKGAIKSPGNSSIITILFFPFLFFLFFSSKQSLYYRKANDSRDSWEGEEESPSLLSYRGFYPLKMGVPTWGPERCGFLPLALPRSVLVQ